MHKQTFHALKYEERYPIYRDNLMIRRLEACVCVQESLRIERFNQES